MDILNAVPDPDRSRPDTSLPVRHYLGMSSAGVSLDLTVQVVRYTSTTTLAMGSRPSLDDTNKYNRCTTVRSVPGTDGTALPALVAPREILGETLRHRIQSNFTQSRQF